MSTVPPSAMPPTPGSTLRTAVLEDLQTLKANWFWFLLFGIALVVVGLMAIGSAWVATVAAVVVGGWFLMVGGVVQLAGAFYTRCSGGVLLHILSGLLSLVVGVLIVGSPDRFAVVFTLFLAALFLVEGSFRLVGALFGQFRGWGWVAFSGVVTILLGVLIWQEWPYSGLWVIGTFVGIDLIFSGMAHIGTALHVRDLPLPPTPTPKEA